MPARVRLPSVGAVGRLSIYSEICFKVSLLVGAGGDSAFNGRVIGQRPYVRLDLGYRGNHDHTRQREAFRIEAEGCHDAPAWSPPDGVG